MNGSIAQLVERCLCKANVSGSNPLTSTTFSLFISKREEVCLFQKICCSRFFSKNSFYSKNAFFERNKNLVQNLVKHLRCLNDFEMIFKSASLNIFFE